MYVYMEILRIKKIVNKNIGKKFMTNTPNNKNKFNEQLKCFFIPIFNATNNLYTNLITENIIFYRSETDNSG